VSGGVEPKAETASDGEMTFLFKKRIMIGNRGFIYKREVKKRIKKISDLFKEGKTETTGKVNAGMKSWQPVWNDVH